MSDFWFGDTAVHLFESGTVLESRPLTLELYDKQYHIFQVTRVVR